MTTYTFAPASSTSPSNWSDPAIWSPHTVPNSSSAEVLVPEIVDLQNGGPAFLRATIQAGESFQAADVTVLYEGISNAGTLTIAHALSVGANGGLYDGASGTYVAQSLENDGQILSSSQFKIAGAAINRGAVIGNLTLTAGTFDNLGTIGSGIETIAVTTPGGFANLSGGTLTGGTYNANFAGESISIDVNQPITTLAATVALADTGTIQTYAATGTSYVTLQSSLATVAQNGFLETGAYANAGALTDSGVIVAYGSAFSAASLTITSGGAIAMEGGTLSAAGGIVDNGVIVTTAAALQNVPGYFESTNLVIGSPVQGNGTIVIGPAAVNHAAGIGGGSSTAVPVSLELAGADTANIIFTDGQGTLKLDAPQSVTGTIEDFTNGDIIVLSGISFSSLVKTAYSGDSTHGTLTLLESNGSTLSLSFRGNYTLADFSVSVGPQELSTSPPSIIVTSSAATSIDFTSAASAITAAQAGPLSAGSVITTGAGDVIGNIDALQSLVVSGQISHIYTTDIDQNYSGIQVAAWSLTAAQFLDDAAALKVVDGAYALAVTGATVAQAASIAGGAHVVSIAVSDSAADIAPQIDELQSLAATDQITSVAVTDPGFATFFLTSAQLTNDRVVLGEMTGNFNLSVSAAAANLELDGIDGHAVTAVFSGTAAQYGIASAGDGVGVTITTSGSSDLLRSVSAVQFSDFTDLIARTPGSGAAGSVTTGNVTEIYGAVFGRLPDLPGLAYYQNILEQNPNMPLTTFAQWFLASPEYVNNAAHNYAQSTAGDTQFVTDSYNNLLHRAPESGAVPYYLNIIQSFTNGLTPGTQAYTTAQAQAHAVVLTDFSASAEFLQDVQVTAQTPSSAQHWLILI